MTAWFSCVWIDHNLFNRSPIDGHFGYFQTFAISNNAIIDNLGHILLPNQINEKHLGVVLVYIT